LLGAGLPVGAGCRPAVGSFDGGGVCEVPIAQPARKNMRTTAINDRILQELRDNAPDGIGGWIFPIMGNLLSEFDPFSLHSLKGESNTVNLVFLMMEPVF
jgi:hypothetical protein